MKNVNSNLWQLKQSMLGCDQISEISRVPIEDACTGWCPWVVRYRYSSKLELEHNQKWHPRRWRRPRILFQNKRIWSDFLRVICRALQLSFYNRRPVVRNDASCCMIGHNGTRDRTDLQRYVSCCGWLFLLHVYYYFIQANNWHKDISTTIYLEQEEQQQVEVGTLKLYRTWGWCLSCQTIFSLPSFSPHLQRIPAIRKSNGLQGS
jgi:hypothetical protein